MENVKLVVAYDGTAYLGWQKTPMGPSIEGTLQKWLEQILQEHVVLQAASRTDAGVHAQGQVVNFFTSKSIHTKRLQISLNSLLPKDIAILEVERKEMGFHPTLDCLRKEYRYNVCHGITQQPHHRLYSWHYPHPLDLGAMQEAAQILKGKQDFSSFCNVKKNAKIKDFIREVIDIKVIPLGDERLCIQVQGGHFLYKMVRNIVGTLVYVGRGKITVRDVERILKAHDRAQAGMTAPAHGLSLFEVIYIR